MKECGLRIRVDQELREEFVNACRSQDLTASQVIRHFMRRYIERGVDSAQSNFFKVLDDNEQPR